MSGDHRDLHVLTHSFPTRRSSDLRGLGRLPRMLQRTLAVLATVTLFSLAACGGDDTGDSGDPKNSDNESKGTCTYTPEGQTAKDGIKAPPSEPSRTGPLSVTITSTAADTPLPLDAHKHPSPVHS